MLSTLYYPNTNPIGPASILPLAVVLYVTWFARLTKWRAILLIAPLGFAGIALLLSGQRHGDADDHLGRYIWILAACCFALEVVLFRSKIAVVYGALVLFPMGGLLMLGATVRSADLIQSTHDLPREWVESAAIAAWCALFSILMFRAVQKKQMKS